MDHCTWFPEHWRGVYIGDCCKEHDENCGSHSFYKCLKKKIGWLDSFFIAFGGGLGCWVKHTKLMFKRLY